MKTVPMFPLRPRERAVPRPRRVMAVISDAGDRYRQYTCQRCGLVWERFPGSDEDERDYKHWERYGTDPGSHRMCPKCNAADVFSAWGETPDVVG